MSIRIYSDGLAGTAASETSRAQELSRTTTGRTSSWSPAGGEDQVQISSLSEALSAQGSQRTARVQDLAAVYQSGRYQVNSMDVSHAIVNNALQAGSTESDR
jgi:anti-sigma28 factor (negative regulator of flagellin synthesis)